MTTIQSLCSNTTNLLTTFHQFDHVLEHHDAMAIHEQFQEIKKVFLHHKKLQHPRDIYPVYHALNFITHKVHEISQEALSRSWKVVLNTLQGHRIYRIGLESILFDTSIALAILNGQKNELERAIVASLYEVNIKSQRKKLVDYIYKTDREAFGTCFQRGFIDGLLKSNAVRCLVAQNSEGEIVGVLWGFLSRYENHDLFHFFEFSRKATMAQMGIGAKLIEAAKQQQWLYPQLQFATLNVDADNFHAKEIYNKKNFEELNVEKKASQIFMVNNLVRNDGVKLNPQTSKKITRNFVIKSLPFYKVIYFEIVRQCEILWKKIWYR